MEISSIFLKVPVPIEPISCPYEPSSGYLWRVSFWSPIPLIVNVHSFRNDCWVFDYAGALDGHCRCLYWTWKLSWRKEGCFDRRKGNLHVQVITNIDLQSRCKYMFGTLSITSVISVGMADVLVLLQVVRLWNNNLVGGAWFLPCLILIESQDCFIFTGWWLCWELLVDI